MKEVKIYNTLAVLICSEDNSWNEDAYFWESEIAEAIEIEEVDLAEYADEYHGSTYYKKLHSIKIGIEDYCGQLYGVATCMVDDDWNEDDTEQLKEYLTGQYADGWGEGFEQREIESYMESEEIEEYDDELEEYYYDTVDTKHYVYCSFWQDKNFRILTESELKG